MSDHTKGTSMSTQIGQPGSAPRPGDSEVGSGNRPPNSIGKVVFASLIGTAVEWYDFFLYGSAAALVFGVLFFPESDPVTATLLAFGTYALGFVARPLGGVVFGHFGDRVGRKKMLVVALMMMGIATFAIGLLPTYASIGIAAPILLLVCRLLQGFAVGGEWGGAVLMAAEHGDEARRGFWSSWPQAGVPLGNLMATGVLFILAAVQSDADFEAWGWRIPFLLSAVLVLIGLYVRLQLEESPVFSEAKAEIAEKKQESSHLPLLEVIKTYPKEVLIAMGMRLAENISYYIFTIVVLTYVTTYLEADTDLILQMLLIAAAGQFFLIPAVGALSDRVGRRPLYLTGAVGVAVWSFFFFDLVKTQESGPVLLAVAVGLFFHSLMYAPQAAFFSELFGTSVRYTGASVGYQLASIFAGAMAPIIALKLLGTPEESNTTAVAIYVSIAAAITIIAVLCAKETRNTSLRHDRVVRDAHV
jgi:metabolite-proton symporter